MALENINSPTAISISPLPYVSALAKRRGKITKSTASMQMTVEINTYALKHPMIGRFPDMSADSRAWKC